MMTGRQAERDLNPEEARDEREDAIRARAEESAVSVHPSDAASADQSVSACIAAAERLRERGNELFKSNQIVSAFVHYTRAIRVLTPSMNPSEEDRRALNAALAPVLSNRAACALNRQGYNQRQIACGDARWSTFLDPSNGKSWARLGQGLLECHDTVGAVQALTRACQLIPNDNGVQALWRRARGEAQGQENEARRFGMPLPSTDVFFKFY